MKSYEISTIKTNRKTISRTIKLKSWITLGILSSITNREEFYSIMLKNKKYNNTLFLINKCKCIKYKNLLNLINKKAKMLYFSSKVNKVNSNMKILGKSLI